MITLSPVRMAKCRLRERSLGEACGLSRGTSKFQSTPSSALCCLSTWSLQRTISKLYLIPLVRFRVKIASSRQVGVWHPLGNRLPTQHRLSYVFSCYQSTALSESLHHTTCATRCCHQHQKHQDDIMMQDALISSQYALSERRHPIGLVVYDGFRFGIEVFL